ncbi:unnamed protein product [Menidia menidia]|uniref:(Atlantic silverside) hypothetical protein n=1 Tax=Menidia menidia TaxID=238744 RepID=A0A8S4B768_9TELE|nr:unnamed protein product [Menidia menidia]
MDLDTQRGLQLTVHCSSSNPVKWTYLFEFGGNSHPQAADTSIAESKRRPPPRGSPPAEALRIPARAPANSTSSPGDVTGTWKGSPAPPAGRAENRSPG